MSIEALLAEALEAQARRDAQALLPTDDAAQFLGVATGTMRWWRHKGVGPKSFKVGGKVMYKRADLQAYLDAQYANAVGGDLVTA